MTQWSFPMLSVDGDRGSNHTDFANFYKNLFSNGVALMVGEALRVKSSPGGGMRLVVSSGASIINGYQYQNTEDFALQVPVASSTQDRIDSVVIRHDVSAREIIIAYKQGNIDVERTDLIWELQLATVGIGKNTVNIFAENINDKRSDEVACGYSSPYEEVSVSGLESKYNSMLQNTFNEFSSSADTNKSYLAQLLTDQQTTFQTWLTNLQNQLDTNQAGNLQNQLNLLTASEDILTITHNLCDYPNVMALYWEYGLGTVGLDMQPAGISFDGSAPETISIKVKHLSRNQVQIKVPIDYTMTNPVVEAVSAKNINLTEGIKSMQIKLGVI